jgi:hypothetical protein
VYVVKRSKRNDIRSAISPYTSSLPLGITRPRRRFFNSHPAPPTSTAVMRRKPPGLPASRSHSGRIDRPESEARLLGLGECRMGSEYLHHVYLPYFVFRREGPCLIG